MTLDNIVSSENYHGLLLSLAFSIIFFLLFRNFTVTDMWQISGSELELVHQYPTLF